MKKKVSAKTTTAQPDLKEMVIANLEIVMQFRHTLNKETDRGCALMAAAFLENELQTLLEKVLVGTVKQKEDLFDLNGPMGTFSAKFKIAYATGLISEQVYRDLDLVRRIRNDFGHDHKPLSFDTNAIKNRIGQLKTHFYHQPHNSRSIFTNTVLGILANIHGRTITGAVFEKPGNIEPDVDAKKIFQQRIADVFNAILNSFTEEELDKSDEEISQLVNKRFFELSKEIVMKATTSDGTK